MNGSFSYSTHFTGKTQTTMSMDAGKTPIIEARHLAQVLGLGMVYLKDETSNPSGSFKDRATVEQLKHWIAEGKRTFTLASSGNAAVSAAYYSKMQGVALTLFLPETIPAYKQERLSATIGDATNITINFSKQPKKDCLQFARQNRATLLLASRDAYALAGYQSLGEELDDALQGQEINGIFMPVSSGTGLLGLANGLKRNVPLYAVQTAKIHPIAERFDHDFVSAPSSLANAISARFVPRMKPLIAAIEASKGSAYVISDTELEHALQDVLEAEGITLSYDSALSVAGLEKALKAGRNLQNVVCILTGK